MTLEQLGQWLPRTFFIYATLPLVAFAQLTPTSQEVSAEVEEPAEKALDPVADASERAHVAFKQGNYQEAVAIYRQAYQQEPVSALLYNIAFIYDQHIGDRALARDYYRRYVSQPDTEPTSRLRAYERIAALEVSKPKKKPAPAPTKTVKVAPAVPQTSVPESTQQTWGYITLGLGGAALVAGTTLAFMTRAAHQDFEAASDITERDDLADRGEGLALGADISFGAAAALGVVGVILVATSPDDTAIVPMSNGRVHGVGWTGSF